MTTNSALESPNGWRPQAYFSHVLRDNRQIERLNEAGGLAIEFRRFGKGRIEVQGGQSERLSLWRTRSSEGFLTVPKFEVDLLSIRFVTQGKLLRRNGGTEFVGQPGRAILVEFGEMREEEASSGFESIGGTISREALLAGYRALEGGSSVADLKFEPVVEVESLPMRALMQSFITLHRRMRFGHAEADLLYPLIEEIMVYQLLSAWPRLKPREKTREPKGTSRHVRLAINYIDAHLAERMTLREIAAAAGIGVRTMQLAFQKEAGTSPLSYIIDRRLDRVHADLCQFGSGVSVKVAATRWGFLHMSDFSHRFRQRFGYSPSHLRTGQVSSTPRIAR